MKIVTNKTRKVQVVCSVTQNMKAFFDREITDHTDRSRIVKKYLFEGLKACGYDPFKIDLGIFKCQKSQ